MWYHFNQNNSGGRWQIDDARGLGPHVWIEAPTENVACARAEDIGIYFNGVDNGVDCECCGDRWSKFFLDDEEKPEIDQERHFYWYDTVYLHHADGTIERVKGKRK